MNGVGKTVDSSFLARFAQSFAPSPPKKTKVQAAAPAPPAPPDAPPTLRETHEDDSSHESITASVALVLEEAQARHGAAIAARDAARAARDDEQKALQEVLAADEIEGSDESALAIATRRVRLERDRKSVV